jgi:hypothetical protein
MEYRVSIELPAIGRNEFRQTQSLTTALDAYTGFCEEAHLSGEEGAVELVIALESELFEKKAENQVLAEPIPAAGDAAQGANEKSIRRVIATNDFQLNILKRGLEALAREIDHGSAGPVTPAQQYELGMLVGMIDDLIKSPPDDKMLHALHAVRVHLTRPDGPKPSRGSVVNKYGRCLCAGLSKPASHLIDREPATKVRVGSRKSSIRILAGAHPSIIQPPLRSNIMAKAKAKKASKAKQSKKAVRKPTELNKDHLAKVSKAMKSEMAAVSKGDQSKVEAIRKIAKRLASVRRIEIEAVLTKAPFNFNVGTVRRQIQEGRA